jgi:tetratricopeptide (TPR) repeat protein
LNRYDEALTRLQDALQLAVATGRRKKVAICSENLGLAYDKRGDYARALAYYLQAREEFAKENMHERLVACDLYLGQTYFNLGQYEQALETLDRTRAIAASKQLTSHLAEYELARARIFLAQTRMEDARVALHLARGLFTQTKQPVYAAFADRLLARLNVQDQAGTLRLLAQSRAVFSQHGQPVDAALCDLTRGELRVERHAWKQARKDFEQALQVLEPSFPNQSWRAEYGLGHVAQAQGQNRKALQHHLTAVQTIASLRAGLGVERLSDDLFGARQHVFADALALA